MSQAQVAVEAVSAFASGSMDIVELLNRVVPQSVPTPNKYSTPCWEENFGVQVGWTADFKPIRRMLTPEERAELHKECKPKTFKHSGCECPSHAYKALPFLFGEKPIKEIKVASDSEEDEETPEQTEEEDLHGPEVPVEDPQESVNDSEEAAVETPAAPAEGTIWSKEIEEGYPTGYKSILGA
jgi:hypothetical protein